LPIRIDLSQSPTFVDLMSRLRAAYLEVLAHREVPLDGIINDWRQQVGHPGAELFPLLFALDSTPVPKLDAPGIYSSPVELDNETAKFDLVLSVREYAADLRVTLVYDTEILDPKGARDFLTAYASLLQQLVDRPQLRPLEVRLDAICELHPGGDEPTFEEFDFE
jgi:non-ribosomal peptide synthetase component F